MNAYGHWFWWLLTVVCIIWYSTITIYVGIRGAYDIKTMLAALQKVKDEENTGPPVAAQGEKIINGQVMPAEE